MHWWQLVFAILFETLATTALKASAGFSRGLPSALCVLAYALSFYLLAQALRVVPVGVAYALWSGAGVVLVSLAAALLFGQRLDAGALAGMALILAGVAVIHLFSRAGAH